MGGMSKGQHQYSLFNNWIRVKKHKAVFDKLAIYLIYEKIHLAYSQANLENTHLFSAF